MSFSGETAAIGGYYRQYDIAAWEIYSNLVNENLEWIQLAAQEVGNLDDVLIGLKDKILAYQVKDKSGNSTYSSLINTEENLLKKMFQGWEVLKQHHPNKRIDVRLLTTQPISEHDLIRSYSGKKKPNFKTFLTEYWKKIKQNAPISESWNAVTKELITTLSCNEKELFEFIKDTHLSFNYTLPEAKDFNIIRWNRINQDTALIRHYIFDTIGKEKKSLFLTKEDFLNQTGLRRRLQSYFQHDFFVDDKHYQPIQKSITQLNNLTLKYSSGYIALIGSAGSGKSTLLTKWLQQSSDRILKYYSYINQDMSYDSGYRGESKYFLHDVLTQIRVLRLQFAETMPGGDRTELAAEFRQELSRFSHDYKQDGLKTFIIVDGLDHIQREQNVEYSLIKDLPAPESIPEGVYFVLGSRTIDGLNDLGTSIKQHIHKDERVIDIAPLSNYEVLNVVKSYTQLSLTEGQLENISLNTQGHPLFLRYTIERLLLPSPEEYDCVIGEQKFTGNIFDEYQKFWLSIEGIEGLKDLLSVAARFRFSFIDLELLETSFGFSDSILSQFALRTRHFFYESEKTKWQYFHNSFKSFLEEWTVKMPLTGKFSNEKDEAIHSRIAHSIQDSNSHYRWNIIYHLFKAKQFKQVISIATQDHFRQQWHQFRNYKFINEDISLAAKAAYYDHNLAAWFRYLLCSSELGQRLIDFDPSDYFDIYLNLSLRDVADSYIFNGRELLVTKAKALDYAHELIKRGEKEHGRKIFELAEPTYILYQSRVVDKNRYNPEQFSQTDESKLIEKWASVAIHFRPLPDVFSLVKSLNVKDSHGSHGEKEENFSKGLKLHLLADTYTAITETFIADRNWKIAIECLEHIQKDIGKGWTLLNLISTILFDVPEADKSLSDFCLDLITNWGESQHSQINLQLCILCTYALKDHEKAKQYFDKLPLPHWQRDEDIYRKSIFNYLFDYTRLYYILTRDFDKSVENFITETKESDIKVLDRQVCSIAKFYALFYHGQIAALNDISVQVVNILNFYHKNFLDLDYKVRELKADILELLINLSRRSSPEFYQRIINTIANDWQLSFTYWKTNEIRDIINSITEDAKYSKWGIERLAFLQERMLEGKRVGDRSEQCILQARSWINLGKIDLAEKNLKEAFKQSFGIRGEKDYQLDYLIEWLPKINLLQPERTQERLSWYLKRLGFIQDTTSHAHGFAVLKTLRMCLESHLGNGFGLFKWLLLNRLSNFPDALEEVLDFLIQTDKQNAILFAKLFTRILLFYQDNGSYGHHISAGLVEGLQAIALIKGVVEEVRIYGIEEKKNAIIQRIINVCESNNIDIALSKKDFPVEDTYTSSDSYKSLHLDTGETFTQADAIKNIGTIDQALIFMSKESENSYFDWTDVIHNLDAQLTEEKLRTFVKSKKFDSVKLAKIGNVAYEAGFKELAKQIGYDALSKSRDAGWLTHYDGGSKLKSYELLLKVDDQAKVRDTAFRDLAFSLKEMDDKRVFENIFPILQIVCPDADLTKLFEEVEAYTCELFKNATLNESVFDFKADPVSVSEFTAKLMTFLYEFPVSNIKEHLEVIGIESFAESQNIIDFFLDHLYKLQYFEGYFTILYGIFHYGNNIIQKQIDRLNELLNNERFDVMYLAYKLLIDLGDASELKFESAELPLIYQMKLNQRPELIVDQTTRLQEIERRRNLRETNDPLEYVMFFKDYVSVISENSRIPEINIAYRIMQMAEQENLPEWYNTLSEHDISGLFKSIEMNMPYIRPRMLRLWPALMKVLNELWKSKSLSFSISTYLCKKIDPLLHTINIHSRASEIKHLTEPTNNVLRQGSANEEWVKNLDESCYAGFLEKINEKVVLAEFSLLKSLDDGRGTEVRQSFISTNKKFTRKSYYIFDGMPYNKNVEEYLILESNEIILFNYCQTFDTRKQWIAINPIVCIKAGWFYSDEGDFRWVNSSGNIMVESIYWIDGNYQNYERLLHSETGYGWYVIASENALETIKSIIDKDLFLHQKCTREYRLYQKRYDTDIDVKNELTKSDKLNY